MKTNDTPRTDYVENGPYPNRAMPHLARDLERECRRWKSTAEKLRDIIQRAYTSGDLEILIEADGQCFISPDLERLGQKVERPRSPIPACFWHGSCRSEAEAGAMPEVPKGQGLGASAR